MVSALALVFVTVMVWLALIPPVTTLNTRLVLLREMGVVGPPVPVAESFTTIGMPLGALSVTMMAPLSTADVGVTDTVTVQLIAWLSGPDKQVPVLVTVESLLGVIPVTL